MKPRGLLLISAIFISILGFSQPEIREIENYIAQARGDWNVPGMSVAVVRDGEILTNRGYGVLMEGETGSVNEHSLFAIASNTKAFVSSAIGVLYQEGKLDLDHNVQMYIPGFKLYDAYASSEATVRDLLCHRLGLGTYSGDVIWYKTDFSASEVIDKIKFVPKEYSFRGGYGYSNLMFITAGEVIHEVSGKSWDQFVKERFFGPLDMDRTITSTNELSSKGNFAIPHKPMGNTNQPIEWVNWDNMGAAGGIISSSSDMAKWLIFQLNNGILDSDTLLHPDVQNLLWTPHNNYTISTKSRKDNPGTNFAGYGLGWGVRDYFGYRLITHGGGYDGMYSQVAMIPELKLGIVILTNSMKGIATPLTYYVINEFIQKEIRDWSAEALENSQVNSRMDKRISEIREARIHESKPSLDLVDYAGTYQTDMLGAITISEANGKLQLDFEHAPDLSADLDHWHYDTFEIKWHNTHAWFDFGTIQFHFNNEREIVGFEFDVPNNDIFFHELKVRKTD